MVAATTVALRVPVLPQVDTETEYEPLGMRKVATPVVPVGDDRVAVAEVTVTSASGRGRLGVPPPGSGGPPTWITVTVSVPDVPL